MFQTTNQITGDLDGFASEGLRHATMARHHLGYSHHGRGKGPGVIEGSLDI